MQVDYGVLKTRIQALVAAETKGPVPTVPKVPGLAPEVLVLKEALGPLIESEIIRASILKKGMKIVAGCEDCLDFPSLKTAEVIGSGFNGTVFDMGKHALKIERISQDYLIGPIEAGQVAELMGKLGIGPKVKSWRLCGCQFATYLVIEMEKIVGMPLKDWRNQKHSRESIKRTQDLLRKKMLLMHEKGYYHNDLNWGNILIDKRGVPWIIDFSYMSRGDDISGSKTARRKKLAESNLAVIDQLDKNKGPEEWSQFGESDAMISRVFDALVKEGTVKAINGQFFSMKVSEFGQM